jgi:hypothetical protein
MITVTGGSWRQRRYVQGIAEFCVQKLMPRMHDIEIEIKLKKFAKNSNAYGYCMPIDDYEVYDRPRHFELEINCGLRLRRLLETVAHELVHAKQFARGELYQGIRMSKNRWQGEWINNDVDYWDLPWEIEAHGREVGLFVRWAEEAGLAYKRWTQDS